jgi:hypothetical protein
MHLGVFVYQAMRSLTAAVIRVGFIRSRWCSRRARRGAKLEVKGPRIPVPSGGYRLGTSGRVNANKSSMMLRQANSRRWDVAASDRDWPQESGRRQSDSARRSDAHRRPMPGSRPLSAAPHQRRRRHPNTTAHLRALGACLSRMRLAAGKGPQPEAPRRRPSSLLGNGDAFQVVNRSVISRRYSSADGRWRRGRKCGDIPLNADKNRWACQAEVNHFRARSRAWVGWWEFSAGVFRYFDWRCSTERSTRRRAAP